MLRRSRNEGFAICLAIASTLLAGTAARGQADTDSAFGVSDERPTELPAAQASSDLTVQGSLAVDDPSSVDWAACWNKTSGQYGAFFNEWKGKGYRPYDIDAQGSSHTRYCAVWIRNDGRDWAGLRDMDSDTFGTMWQAYRDQGYRLVDQKAYLRNGVLNYAGIWIENRENVAWASYRNMSEATWVERFNQFRDDDYRPLDVEVYTDASGVKRFAAIFVKNDEGIDWASYRDMSATTYAQRFEDLSDKGYQVYKLHSYRIAGVQRYAAIWYRASSRKWAANRDMSVEGLADRVAELKDKNYRPIGITRYEGGDGYGFAAVFRQNTNSSITTAMFRKIDAFDGVLGIYAENLSTGKSVRFSSSESLYLASVTKVGVMAHLYRQFDGGALKPTSKRTFTEAFYREEGKTLVHADIGNRYTLDEYAEFMINDSDTSSTDILVDHLGAANVNRTIRSLKLGSFGDITSIASLDKNIWARVDARFANEPDHIFEDWLRNDPELYQLSFSPDFSDAQKVAAFEEYYATGLNSASPKAIESLVELMAREQLWSESASEDMLDKLRLNRRPKFGRKLPSNVRCGSKGGDKFQVETEVGFIENSSGTPIIAWAILGNEVTAPDAEVEETYGELGRLIYNAIK